MYQLYQHIFLKKTPSRSQALPRFLQAQQQQNDQFLDEMGALNHFARLSEEEREYFLESLIDEREQEQAKTRQAENQIKGKA